MEFLEQTIISQYANSPTLISWLESLNASIDPINIINSFYNNVWNIDTAQGYGLDVWGRIVGVNRLLNIGATDFWGFKQGLGEPFGQAPLYNGASSTSVYFLSDSAFRLLILVKALANISNASASTYNKMLLNLFPNRGNAYITSSGNMFAILTFQFLLQPFEIAILKQSGAFSPPTGVLFDIMILEPPSTFGFKQQGGAPLNQGILWEGFA